MLELYENEYFELNALLLRLVGVWPTQTKMEKMKRRLFIFSFLLFSAVTHVYGMKKWCSINVTFCFEDLEILLGICIMLVKYGPFIVFENKMKSALLSLAEVWSSLEDEEEAKIMKFYAKRSKQVVYFFIGLTIVATFSTVHCYLWSSTVLDLIIPLNESRPKPTFAHGEFFVDLDEYYYEIQLVYIIYAYVFCMLLFTVDTTYIMLVLQSIGLFKIVKFRLSKAANHASEDEFVYATIISAIKIHERAYQFLEKIKSIFSFSFLMLLGLLVPCDGFGVIYVLEEAKKIPEILRSSVLIFCSILHLLYLSTMGQYVTDTAADIFLHLYSIRWYNISEKSKKLLKFMMLRSIKPCILSAGGFYIMSLETAGRLIKLTVSYSMIALSLHQKEK